MKYEAVVIGTSAGGLYVLTAILEALPATFPLPIIIVQHRSKDERTLLEEVLSQKCKIHIKQVDEKEIIKGGTVYFAPPDYHLLIEQDRTFSLSCDERVNYSRPSIDVLFETAAYTYKDKLLAIILTGANQDGANGIRTIRKMHGTTIAQDPANALYPAMPKAAIATGCVQNILSLEHIKNFVLGLYTV
ncbi:chemotaxis protein CheB [Pontibacter cellulosilyticus]|uniref:protein-glutamate methylesterase n=1 Tax=Pontibacter cellulosilyticus TaxID=1720253 RepID=A0A923N6G6_9BACT|nr:chemotaxis protein CheB [Pontibacter cellulosilyticus]MBC5993538.1 chemotaxis protein CheB [Pontibacter cellulosilyticus]